MIQKFAGYGFNKSHSTAYALIAYMTAYLKAHYPVTFMGALLSGDIPGRNFKHKDKLVEHLEDCTRMEIEVVAPDVNTSDVDFAVRDNKIFFALSAIKGCGGGAAESIVVERKENGPFKDLFDFCERVESSACNRAAVETLIKAGAFDSCGAHRSQWAAVLDRALQSGASAAADRRAGQMNLFGGDEETEQEAAPVDLPDIPEWEERDSLAKEKEVLGFYLTSHPLAEFETQLGQYCTHKTSDLTSLPDRTEVFVGGMLSAIKLAHVKKVRDPSQPTKYANFDLEDMEGNVRCILWPRSFVEFGEMVQADAILVARAKVDRRGGGDEANLIIDELIALDQLDERYTQGVRIRVDETAHGEEGLQRLFQIVQSHPGSRKLELHVLLADGRRVVLDNCALGIDASKDFRERVDSVLSPGNLRVITQRPQSKPPSKPAWQRG